MCRPVGANETGAAANQMLSAAKEMSSRSAALQGSVDGFLQQIRAG